ncbi:MAG: hypothetical protein ACXWNK_06740 [Vulcanimicrobiaceae bacterium]
MRQERMWHEPFPKELEAFLTDEERTILDNPDTPEDEKAEIAARLDRRREADLDETRPDEPP